MPDPESAPGRDMQRDPTADVPPACEESSAAIVEDPPLALQALALLVAGPIAARMCGVSPRTWRRLNARGLIPNALHLGGKRRVWAVEELRAWTAAGAPCRERWEARKERGG